MPGVGVPDALRPRVQGLPAPEKMVVEAKIPATPEDQPHVRGEAGQRRRDFSRVFRLGWPGSIGMSRMNRWTATRWAQES